MQAVIDLIDEKITESEVLYGVSWEMYENLLEKYRDENCPRFTYDSGILEIEMTNSDQHEENNRVLNLLFELVSIELEINFRLFGSMTFKKKMIRKGFEPDSCFYVESLSQIEGETNIGIENKFPPDLIIEVNRTSSSIPRMPIFAAFGVKEIWRYDRKVNFYKLEQGVYLETENSVALPILTSEKATEFLEMSRKISSTNWAKMIREWVKEETSKK